MNLQSVIVSIPAIPLLLLLSCGGKDKPGSSATTATFSSIRSTIFVSKCFSCHSAGGGNQGGLNLETYASTLTAVVTGAPDSSSLWLRISGTAGSLMPQGGPKLADAEIDAVRQWIQNGALNN